jgi:hypothetical protein
MRSFVAVPMPVTVGGPAAGVLKVTSRRAHGVEADDIAALQIIAGMAGQALSEAAASVSRASVTLYRTLVEHLPDTSVLVFDPDLRLEMATGVAVMTGHNATVALPGRCF